MSDNQIDNQACINCDIGRENGCNTYCCMLLVRINESEYKRYKERNSSKRFLDKGTDGYCIYLDRNNHRCAIWNKRPRVCREYNCNDDKMLQVAISNEFNTLSDLIKLSQKTFIPKETWIKIPSDKN